MIDSIAKTLSFPWQDTVSYTMKKVRDLVDVWSVAFNEEDYECPFVKLPSRPLFHPSDGKPVNQVQLTSTLWLFPQTCVTPMALLWWLTCLQKLVAFGGDTSELFDHNVAVWHQMLGLNLNFVLSTCSRCLQFSENVTGPLQHLDFA